MMMVMMLCNYELCARLCDDDDYDMMNEALKFYVGHNHV